MTESTYLKKALEDFVKSNVQDSAIIFFVAKEDPNIDDMMKEICVKLKVPFKSVINNAESAMQVRNSCMSI